MVRLGRCSHLAVLVQIRTDQAPVRSQRAQFVLVSLPSTFGVRIAFQLHPVSDSMAEGSFRSGHSDHRNWNSLRWSVDWTTFQFWASYVCLLNTTSLVFESDTGNSARLVNIFNSSMLIFLTTSTWPSLTEEISHCKLCMELLKRKDWCYGPWLLFMRPVVACDYPPYNFTSISFLLFD